MPSAHVKPLTSPNVQVSISSFMDSTSQCCKVRKVDGAMTAAESIDRISSLPNSVLCYILSFLPTKYGVGTSILSTRWKYLFTSIPSIDLDDSLLLHPRGANKKSAKKMTKKFMNFVDRVLVLRNGACMDRFRLRCGENIDASRVNSWICAALCRNIRELDLCISMKEFTMLPCDLFTCGTLVVLKLGTTFVLNVPIKVCLPNLKIIHLNNVEFLDDDSIQRLVSSCPVLEELVILGCDWDNIRALNISAPALKRLTINSLPDSLVVVGTEFCKYKIVINAPNLVYLEYIDFVPEGFSAKHLQSVVEAHIDVGYGGQQMQDKNPNHIASIAEVLRGISNAQFLYLSKYFMEAVGVFYHTLPTFSNVTHLKLGVDEFVGWRMLPDLLQSSPLLQTLAFVEGLFNHSLGDSCLCQWNPPQDVPSCLLFHLQTIEIKSFEGRKEELNMVKYFLKNAIVLQKMIIHTRVRGEKEAWEISKKLLVLPRGSNECEIVIS